MLKLATILAFICNAFQFEESHKANALGFNNSVNVP